MWYLTGSSNVETRAPMSSTQVQARFGLPRGRMLPAWSWVKAGLKAAGTAFARHMGILNP